jgi:hypothetical protein
VQFSKASRDELRVLGPEIENENGLVWHRLENAGVSPE